MIELVRRGWLTDNDEPLASILRAAAAVPAARAGALAVIACVPLASLLPILVEALEVGDSAAIAAIEDLDADGAGQLARWLTEFSPLARAALARALGWRARGAALIAQLIDDARSGGRVRGAAHGVGRHARWRRVACGAD